jgi:hypothetical protein
MSVDHIVMGAAASSAGAGAGDPNWASVTLLLKFDGVSGSNTFTDLSSAPITVTATGNPVISSTQVKYGTGSVYINGGTSSNTHYLGTSNVASVQLGTTYTIEGWFWTANTATQRYFGKYTAGVGGWLLLCTNANITWYFAGDGASNISASVTVPMSSWNHIAISATPTVSNLYLNGVQVGTFANPPAPQNDANGFRIGTYVGGTGYDFTGYVDDFRITKGVARYTSNFTPPSTMLTSVADTSVTTYVDDVFSTYLYTGNGAVNTVTTGVDLLTNGGLIWTKNRGSATDHWFTYSNSAHIANSWSYIDILHPNTTDTRFYSGSAIDAFTTTGFHIAGGAYDVNYASTNYASWSFRKAPKFFDIVSYTGDGASSKLLNHALTIAPGMVIIKNTSASSNWGVWHANGRGGASDGALALNLTDTPLTPAFSVTATTFSVYQGTSNFKMDPNISGNTYVAYLFAHDASVTGMIQCGAVASNASGIIPITNLGWEPQFMLIKNITSAWNWELHDVARGWSIASNANAVANSLKANLSDAESSGSSALTITPTGFYSNANFGVNQTYIYMVIRRPNKPPTSGTQVFNTVAKPGSDSSAKVYDTGIYGIDMVMAKCRDGTGYSQLTVDRLRGLGTVASGAAPHLSTEGTAAETSLPYFYLAPNGLGVNTGWTTAMAFWSFKRAPGFFDMVCYTGNASANQLVNHNLTTVPELIIRKSRSNAQTWGVWCKKDSTTGFGNLSLESTSSSGQVIPLSLVIQGNNAIFPYYILSSDGTIGNTAGYNYVAYLFATLAGVSKVGSYTGNGGSQTIACGFTTGARFIMIKRTDSAGDWYVWDTARGITTGNDIHVSVNTTVGEVTTNDSIDPDTTGFIVNQVAATNINVTSATYIFLAIA